jgi:hypothetical protein
MASAARHERNLFAKEIISRLDRIEQQTFSRTSPGLAGLCQKDDGPAKVEMQSQNTIKKLQETVMVLSGKLERMEMLLFSADFEHFAKIDQFVKGTVHGKSNIQLFDITMGDSEPGESLKMSGDTLADTLACSSVRVGSEAEDGGTYEVDESAELVHSVREFGFGDNHILAESSADRQSDLPVKPVSREAAVQACIHRSITFDEDATDYASIEDYSTYTGTWVPLSKTEVLKVGDFVKVEKDTESMNPGIVVKKDLYGRVRKLDGDGDPYVFFPEVDFRYPGTHWVRKKSLLRPASP